MPERKPRKRAPHLINQRAFEIISLAKLQGELLETLGHLVGDLLVAEDTLVLTGDPADDAAVLGVGPIVLGSCPENLKIEVQFQRSARDAQVLKPRPRKEISGT